MCDRIPAEQRVSALSLLQNVPDVWSGNWKMELPIATVLKGKACVIAVWANVYACAYCACVHGTHTHV